MRKLLAVLALVFLSGCVKAGISEHECSECKQVMQYTIDSDFSPEQVEMIRVGMAFWASELGNVELQEQPMKNCAEREAGCFVAVPADAAILVQEDGEVLGGRCLNGWIALSTTSLGSGEVFALAAAHEFGHRLGLMHSDGGLMVHDAAAQVWELTAVSVERLEKHGLEMAK